MSKKPLRLAFVWAGGGSEQEYYQFTETIADRIKIFLACSRVGDSADGNDHAISALLETARIDWITEAARRILCLKPDCVFWACTSGSFVVGRAGAEAQVAALEEATGVPGSSTSLAFIRALQELRLHRVGVLAPYPEPAARAFTNFLGEFGVTVESLQWLDVPSGWDSAALDRETVLTRVAQAATVDVDCVVVPDTALPTLHLVEEMERCCDCPVLTANAVTLWQAIKLAGGSCAFEGYGGLLSRP